MSSLTLISKALRSTARLTARTSILRSNPSVKYIPRINVAKFSTSAVRKNQITQDLNKVLTDELKFEEGDAFGLDESFKGYLGEQNIEIINTDGKVLAELVKKTPEETIHIYFDVLRISQTSYQLKQMQEQMQEQSEYLDNEIADAAFADVNVVVSKNGKAVGFDLSLSLIDSQFTISGITNFADSKIALSDSPEAAASRDMKYSGPEFSNLAEELQESFTHYLSSRGIDNQLAEFILAYSGVKENNEYINWLESLKKFTV